MVEGSRQPSFEALKEFTTAAIQEGAHFWIPLRPGQTQENWNQELQILVQHVFFPDVSHVDLGEQYKITNETSRKTTIRKAQELHAASSPALQIAYPIDIFSFKKPRGRKYVERQSSGHGGKFSEVLELTEQGKTALEIQNILGIDSRELSTYRRLARKFGIKVPRLLKDTKAELEKGKNPDPSEEDKDAILDKLNFKDFVRYAGKDHSGLVRLADIARQANVITSSRTGRVVEIIEALRQAGVRPKLFEREDKNGMKRYAAVLEIDAGSALSILQGPEFDKFRKKPKT